MNTTKETEKFIFNNKKFIIFLEYAYNTPFKYEVHEEGADVKGNLKGTLPKEWTRQASYKQIKTLIIQKENAKNN